MVFLSTLATLATLVILDPRKVLSHIFEIAHGKMDMIHNHMVRSQTVPQTKKTAKHCQTPADHGLFSMAIVPISRTQSETQGPSRWTPAVKKSPRIFRLFGTPSAARTTKAGMFQDLNEYPLVI